MKLSPGASDITSVAVAVEEAGADAISLINTLVGMAIDVRQRKPSWQTTLAEFRVQRSSRLPFAWCIKLQRPSVSQ